MHCQLSTAQILAMFPGLPWLKPITISFMGGGPVTQFGCRLCIAQQGMNIGKAADHPKTQEQFDAHMAQVHMIPKDP